MSEIRTGAPTPPGTNNVVAVDGASMVFNEGHSNQVDALSDIDLVIRPGDFVSLIGPSGCGKTTLLSILGLLDSPDALHFMLVCSSGGRSRRTSSSPWN